MISVIIAEISDTESVGGSKILSYSLEWDMGLNGSAYVAVTGYDSDSLVLAYNFTGLSKGKTYQFRHRVRNVFGWSPYSAYISQVAAGAPYAPAAPVTSNT